MAESLQIDLGVSILVGTLLGLVPALVALWVGKIFDQRWPITLSSENDPALKADFSEAGLPPIILSLLPVALPVLLVTSVSILGAIPSMLPYQSQLWYQTLQFLGNKNVALLLGALIAIGLVILKLGRDRKAIEGFVSDALQTAGVIILITSAGGAFGAMIRHSGIESTIANLSADGRGLILMAWGVAAILKIAQGSGTVAMITTSAMMANIVNNADLAFHPVYIYAAIGFGSLFGSWMNDSGFWVVGKMSGFTEQQTLKTWTVLLAIIALVGLVETLALSYGLPMASVGGD